MITGLGSEILVPKSLVMVDYEGVKAKHFGFLGNDNDFFTLQFKCKVIIA